MSWKEIFEAIKKAHLKFLRWVDAFWGYDVFIAHRRADAAEYAHGLFESLSAERVSCFIDRVVYGPGDSLLIATSRHVTKSTLFLLVGSPQLLVLRKPVDWIEREIETYLASHQDPKLMLVDFGATVENALASTPQPDGPPNPIFHKIQAFLRISQSLIDLEKPPSEEVLAAVRRNLDGRRRDRNRLWFFEGVAGILAALLLLAAGLFIETQRELDRANRALAAGILSDLDLKRDESLTAHQRNALWKLATADEKVRAAFISALLASGKELARTAAGFREVSRSLGLQWPSSVDDEKLLAVAVVEAESVSWASDLLAANLTEAQAQQVLAPLLQQIGKTTDPDTLRALAEALRAVGAKLTEAQAQQALAPLLQQIGKTTDRSTLAALAKAVQELVAKVTEGEAKQALAPLLQQIGKTTGRYNLELLAQALRAVAAKLTEAQAQQSLAPLLQQIDKTTDPDTLQTLAEVLQAVGAKLTEAQAQQAIAPLLQQIDKTTDPNALWALAEALRALPAQLTEAQMQQAIAPLLQQIVKTTDPEMLRALAGALRAVGAKVTEAQAQQALVPVLQQIGKTTDPETLIAVAKALEALPAKPTEAQTQQVLAPLLQQIVKTTDRDMLQVLAEALRTVGAKLTDAQAQQALVPLLQQIGKSPDLSTLEALAKAFQAVARS